MGSQTDINTCTVLCTHSNQGLGPQIVIVTNSQCHKGVPYISMKVFGGGGADMESQVDIN